MEEEEADMLGSALVEVLDVDSDRAILHTGGRGVNIKLDQQMVENHFEGQLMSVLTYCVYWLQ